LAVDHAALRCGPHAVFKPFSCFVFRDWLAGAALRSLLEVALVFGNTLNKVEAVYYVMLPEFVFGCFDSF
jgi:hypothetical protein